MNLNQIKKGGTLVRKCLTAVLTTTTLSTTRLEQFMPVARALVPVTTRYEWETNKVVILIEGATARAEPDIDPTAEIERFHKGGRWTYDHDDLITLSKLPLSRTGHLSMTYLNEE